MSANERQVGGDHYKSEYQHWDFVEDVNLPYLEACATKYVTRARKKNGVQDLEKTVHYIDKLVDRLDEFGRGPTNYIPARERIGRFIELNRLDDLEEAAFNAICRWRVRNDLLCAKELVKVLLAREKSDANHK